MGMNVKGPSDGDDDDGAVMSEINVTPLVDVMLVLLIIFIVTAPLTLSSVPVKLPKASLDEMGKPVDPLILSMDNNGLFYFEENKTTQTFQNVNELQAGMTQVLPRYKQYAGKDRFPVVYVRADQTVEYGKVYALIKLLGKVGFYKVSLMSEAPQ
jgi:biopolymer transport protein ExbD